MIDLHCHLLPGLDDGPKTLDEAVDLARLLVAQGVDTVLATPHWTPAIDPAAFIRQRDEALDDLRRALDKAGLQLKLLAGAECRLTDDRMLEILERHPHCASGGLLPDSARFMLVELPPMIDLKFFETFVFQAQAAGWLLILAHAERHPDVQANPMAMRILSEHGLRIQVNAEAVCRWLPWREHRTAMKLLKSGLVDVIASDAHNCHNRPPYLLQALKKAINVIGPDAAKLFDPPFFLPMQKAGHCNPGSACRS